MRRFLLLLIVGLGLSPGTFWRFEPPPPNHEQILNATPLPLPAGERARIGGADGLLVTGVWKLSSPNDDFGSYSALLAPDDRTLLALSDRGAYLRMAMPPPRSGAAGIGAILPGGNHFKHSRDIEAAAQDHVTGRIWMALEGRNAILRGNADFGDIRAVSPQAMQGWPRNSGPEAMTRLADGRFIVLSEELLAEDGRASMGLLFSGDPLKGGEPLSFTLRPPEGYNPSDMAVSPDGRVLILLRGVRIGIPPHFAGRLLVADPATIEAGKSWKWETLAELEGPVPRDNYEGLTVTGGAGGGPAVIWLISDDNGAEFIQRSLLVRLEWHGGSKVPRGPRE